MQASAKEPTVYLRSLCIYRATLAVRHQDSSGQNGTAMHGHDTEGTEAPAIFPYVRSTTQHVLTTHHDHHQLATTHQHTCHEYQHISGGIALKVGEEELGDYALVDGGAALTGHRLDLQEHSRQADNVARQAVLSHNQPSTGLMSLRFHMPSRQYALHL